ncbi:MAG: PhoH family protein [Myxococcota bacterium]|jgi:PhoH-like ATPase|nr:PhoH family protein [Myxococcota bacterium]
MRKNFVLDTNVLLHDPRAIFAFADNNVIIPIFVIEEIDTFKKDLNELGRNARTVSRTLDDMREVGSLAQGVALPGGGTLRVAFSHRALPREFTNRQVQDNSILAVALDVLESDTKIPTVFISKDVNLRIRADALGISAQDYNSDKVDIEELYPGWRQIEVDGNEINLLHKEGSIPASGPVDELHPNELVLLVDAGNPNHTYLARYTRRDRLFIPLRRLPPEGIWGIKPRNREQHFAMELLLDDSLKLVTLVGKAGTGKTLLALAAGLKLSADDKHYQRLLVSRPIFPLGKDIGYLPGSVEEKLNPWMQPIFDNIELLLGIGQKERRGGRGYEELLRLGLVSIEPLTYIRGRSIPSQYMIIDEAQNLTPHETKTILTRAGDDTKVIFTGDPYQIDNPYVDASSNGLAYLVNKFQHQEIAGHMTLAKGERSPLAELAANLL